ncbi:hypothetical protein DY000_02062781 [Brassica cretica]|uniref:Uncharacterized protein n=1 Tax=Brassica cretica TaxID=69181 RepID=A0ABQ7B189_BRACR|nr:hypothetical protein DY000_02062781 [Brassica cretica]
MYPGLKTHKRIVLHVAFPIPASSRPVLAQPIDDLSPFQRETISAISTFATRSQPARDRRSRYRSRPVSARNQRLSNVPARDLPFVRGPSNPIGG